MYNRIYNFSAGPGMLPEPVLEQARDEMLNHHNSGMAVMEMSHRSKSYQAIQAHAEAGLRDLLNIPAEYKVLFLQGGASLQFSMAPMNLVPAGGSVDVLHTGAWTKKAIGELKKQTNYRLAASTEAENFTRLPSPAEIDLDPAAAYVHICTNNTIFGTRWADFPDTGHVPLVADMSSEILSRPIDVSRFGLIFAGAQKNIGPAGVTVVIMRPDLADRAPANLPTMLDYRTYITKDSAYNTPPTFGIYMVGLVMDWLKAEGGLTAIEARNEHKASLLYQAIDANDFYYCPVNPADRSRMNVVFRVTGDREDLEKQFIAEAAEAGLTTLKGHRSVGGLRASIYNAMPVAGVEALVQFMADFAARQ